jgi:hypothetical protein
LRETEAKTVPIAGWLRITPRKAFQDKGFASNGRVVITARTEAIVTALSHPFDRVRLGNEKVTWARGDRQQRESLTIATA